MGGPGGHVPPQFLAEQLTLSQPGGQITPTTVLSALPDFQTLRRPWNVQDRCLFAQVSRRFRGIAGIEKC